ncbi:hypothetical protein A9Q77_02615 [Marinomonas sp. 42_23_T18]|nr:hypothetical protein A9Q77_02615 [Marinomonas sp. 42_23_T18]
MDKTLKTRSNISVEQDDFLGPGFKALTLNAQDKQICTLVHHPAADKAHTDQNPTAILYVHGYTDYFYQTEQTAFFNQLGLDFYAVDLHSYGRSIRPFQHDHNKNSFSNYFADLDVCLQTMANRGVRSCVILGHSTGGLIVSRYLSKVYHKDKLGINIVGLILNSPFFSLPMPLNQERWRLPLYRFISRALSGISLPANKNTLYAQSIHQSLGGEWPYRLDWKPSQGSPLSFSWLNQIMREQKTCLQSRCDIPTLLCRSSHSTYYKKTLAETQQGDAVLDVDNMEAKAKTIFTQLDIVIINKGFHDLALSPSEVRHDYYKKIQNWLSTYQNT